MSRTTKALNKTQIENAKPKEKEYIIADGGGLNLRVKPTGSKIWVFNYISPTTNKRTNLTIGRYPDLLLADARSKREEYRALIAKGTDPQQEKERIKQENKSRTEYTFLSVAESYFNGIYQQKAKNPETREKNWLRLKKNIFPYIGDKHISEINVKTLVNIYEKISDKSNTLKKVHQLIGAIMDHAITKGIIDSHNCRLAIKSFHIKASTPHPTIKIDELSKFFQDLNKAKLSKFTYLLICWSFFTALRPKEAVSAEWSEIDLDKKLWNIPKEKMKGQVDKKRAHSVPLSSQAIRLLEIIKPLSGNSPFVFPGRSSMNKTMNKATVNVALKRIGYQNKLTSHGIRGFVKTFLASQKVDRNVSETVLSHLLAGGDELENI